MKVTVFQSSKGDCLLLESSDSDPRRMLVDGGMAGSYTKHVAPTLSEIREAKQILDLVYVSHIDEDHITGILRMLDDLVDWRVYDFQRQRGNRRYKKPKSKRPPEIGGIWHNAFNEQVPENAGSIERMLAATALILNRSEDAEDVRAADHNSDLATSVPQAIRVSRRIRDEQLGIPLNKEARGKLMLYRRRQRPIPLGSMCVSIIGPSAQDLRILRKEWNDWLDQNGDALAKIEAQAREDEERLATAEIARLIRPMLAQARELGDRSKVTAPNLASLMLLVEEDGKSVLLTGDGHHRDIIRGLKNIGKLDSSRGLHVDVLKVQHHGSEYNVEESFCKRVTANHYVFCGNGAHENPDTAVVELFIDSRLGPPERRSPNPEAGDPFKLWFNASAGAVRRYEGKYHDRSEHMKRIENLVRQRAAGNQDKMDYCFLSDDKFTIEL